MQEVTLDPDDGDCPDSIDTFTDRDTQPGGPEGINETEGYIAHGHAGEKAGNGCEPAPMPLRPRSRYWFPNFSLDTRLTPLAIQAH